jgi:hypothetical protein
MSDFNISKVRVIVDLVTEQLKDADEYRFACDLTVTERVFLEKHFNVIEIEDYVTTKLYKLTKR